MRIENLKLGDILLLSGNSLLAKLIQLFTRCRWNHAQMYRKNNIVWESLEHGWQMTDLRKRLKGNRIIVKRPTFTFDEKKLCELADSWIGKKPYDFMGTLFFQMLHQSFGGWIGKKGKKAEKRLYCSEAVMTLFNEITGRFEKCYEMAPEDIADDNTNFDTFDLEY
jgi:hypothetical protein